jgi:tetratricopeptide (TPR) repeat protein/transcriptional regulator with XRE-family HTH domain
MSGEHRLSGNFGEVLRTYRKRKGLTQTQLAKRLGVHLNTISAWERGSYLPETRGMVLELARQLHLEEQGTRHLLEASLTGLAPHWGIPTRRNPFFTGRQDMLERLQAHLRTEPVVALTQTYALHGLGGVGKTQVALEYAYRYALQYQAIFWIAAETVEQIYTSLLKIAQILQLPGCNDQNQQGVISEVQRWLSTHSGWLLIWDNVEDLDLFARFLPASREGTILITTRSQALGTLAQGVDLGPMPQEEGMLLLLRRAKLLSPQDSHQQVHQIGENQPTELQAAEEIVRELGGLPLALDQAGAYIEETGCSISDYLHLYQRQRAFLLNRRGAASTDHPHSVVSTLHIASQRVANEHPAAFELLCSCAFLAADAIPEEFFVEGASLLGSVLGQVAADPAQLDLALAALRSLSLLTRDPQTHTLSVHRLVQAVLREELSPEDHQLWARRLLAVMSQLFPSDEMATTNYWQVCERLLPHALSCITLGEEHPGDELACITLMNQVATYLSKRARYTEATHLFQQAVSRGELAFGNQHTQRAVSLSGLAESLWLQDKVAEAEPLYQQALHLSEQLLGETHPEVAVILANLAALRVAQGRYEEARQLRERAVRIQEQALGPEHPQVARSLGRLALLLNELGKYEEARVLYERALRIQEQALGPEHSQVAVLFNNLAVVYQNQGAYEQAQRLYQQALEIWEQQLGPKHIRLSYPLCGLADISREQGKYEEAEQFYQRSLQIREQVLGERQPELVSPLSGLAKTAGKEGRQKEAEAYFQRALTILEEHNRSTHPDTARVLAGLGVLSEQQGNFEQAKLHFQRALSIQEQKLDPDHPDVAASLLGLTRISLEHMQYEEAENLARRALSICEKRLGASHLETARSLVALAKAIKKQGKEEQAENLFQHAILLFEERLGQTHPETMKAREIYFAI